jgi:hypothetical protein
MGINRSCNRNIPGISYHRSVTHIRERTMNQMKHENSQMHPLRSLIFAIAFATFAIVAFVFTIFQNDSQRTFFWIPIIATLISLFFTILSLEKGQSYSVSQHLSELLPSFKKSRLAAFFEILGKEFNGLIASLIFLALLGIGILAYGYISRTLELVIIGIVLFFFSLIFSSNIYTLLHKKLESVLNSATPFDAKKFLPNNNEFIINRCTIVYEYLPDGITLFQRKRLEIEARRSGLTNFTNKYRWTGSGSCTVKVIPPDFQIANEYEEEIPSWEYFDVVFPHALQKGEKTEFEVEWELVDEKNTAVKFLSTTIDTETTNLVLEVILPTNLAPKRAYAYEFTKYIDVVPIETNEIKWDQKSNKLHLEVRHPKKYYRYLIRWYDD